mgnify:CR=1 FL=1
MSELSKAKWEPLGMYARNRDNDMGYAYGLRWNKDPWNFLHRALVFTRRDSAVAPWYLRIWSINPPDDPTRLDKGEWIDCGEFKSKYAAMVQARRMVPLFHALHPTPGDNP